MPREACHARTKKILNGVKREAAERTRIGDVPLSHVAGERARNANMLGRWCREQKADDGKVFRGQRKTRDKEVAAPKRELAGVKKEREFLRDVAAFFTKASKRSTA